MPNPLDLEMSLERGDEGAYDVTLRAGKGADNEWEAGPFAVRIDLAALRALAGDPEGYGRALSDSLFTHGDLRAAFAAARGEGGADGVRLRIRTARNAPELQRVQWELLTDPEGGGFLSTREDVVVSRYLARGTASATASLPGRKDTLRWVAAAANPTDLEKKYGLAAIDVAAEQARIRGLQGVELACIPDSTAAVPGRCTLDALIEAARDADVLYLACHGRMVNDTPWLLLENELGLAARVSGKKLVEAVQGLASKPRLIVLASCESGGGTGDAFAAIGPRLVAAGVPAVVAMQGLVTISLVQDFMPVFFRELVRDGRIDRALAFARRAVSDDHPDWWSPVLYMNLRSGQLWQEIAPAPGSGGPGHTVVGSGNIVIGDVTNAAGITILTGGASETTKQIIPREIDKPENAFFGRVSELTRMHKAVREQGSQVIEIYGVDGTGKTTLARVLVAGIKENYIFGLGIDSDSEEKKALARQLAGGIKDLFPDGQVYLNLRGSGGLPDSKEQMPLKAIPALRSVLESFGIHPGPASAAAEIDEDAERERLEGLYQSALNDRRAVILLDNAASSAQVMPFLSPPGDCLVIITAWQRFHNLPGVYTVSLGKMPVEEAKAMFASLAPNVDRLVEELVNECDRLPSLIQLWAGILNSSAAITPELALRKMRDENRRPPQLLQLGESALSVSYQMLTEQQKLDWRRLAVLPLEFDPIEAAVVWGLLLPGATQEQKEDAWFEADLRLIDLRDYNLVEFNESQRKYSLLNAFRPYARLKMTSQEANEARKALEAYRAV